MGRGASQRPGRSFLGLIRIRPTIRAAISSTAAAKPSSLRVNDAKERTDISKFYILARSLEHTAEYGGLTSEPVRYVTLNRESWTLQEICETRSTIQLPYRLTNRSVLTAA